MSETTDPVSQVAVELRRAVLNWDPDSRLLGNVRAEDILRVCEAASGADDLFKAIESLEAERDEARAEVARLKANFNALYAPRPACPDCGRTDKLAESVAEPGRFMCRRCFNDFDLPATAGEGGGAR